jgi:hypothetical protein
MTELEMTSEMANIGINTAYFLTFITLVPTCFITGRFPATITYFMKYV